jgi:hypothetical protein
MDGFVRVNAAMAAAVSRKKQRLMSAASAGVSGGESLVLENPVRGALTMMPSAHRLAVVGLVVPARRISSCMVENNVRFSGQYPIRRSTIHDYCHMHSLFCCCS